MPTVYSTS